MVLTLSVVSRTALFNTALAILAAALEGRSLTGLSCADSAGSWCRAAFVLFLGAGLERVVVSEWARFPALLDVRRGLPLRLRGGGNDGADVDSVHNVAAAMASVVATMTCVVATMASVMAIIVCECECMGVVSLWEWVWQSRRVEQIKKMQGTVLGTFRSHKRRFIYFHIMTTRLLLLLRSPRQRHSCLPFFSSSSSSLLHHHRFLLKSLVSLLQGSLSWASSSS